MQIRWCAALALSLVACGPPAQKEPSTARPAPVLIVPASRATVRAARVVSWKVYKYKRGSTSGFTVVGVDGRGRARRVTRVFKLPGMMAVTAIVPQGGRIRVRTDGTILEQGMNVAELGRNLGRFQRDAKRFVTTKLVAREGGRCGQTASHALTCITGALLTAGPETPASVARACHFAVHRLVTEPSCVAHAPNVRASTTTASLRPKDDEGGGDDGGGDYGGDSGDSSVGDSGDYGGGDFDSSFDGVDYDAGGETDAVDFDGPGEAEVPDAPDAPDPPEVEAGETPDDASAATDAEVPDEVDVPDASDLDGVDTPDDACAGGDVDEMSVRPLCAGGTHPLQDPGPTSTCAGCTIAPADANRVADIFGPDGRLRNPDYEVWNISAGEVVNAQVALVTDRNGQSYLLFGPSFGVGLPVSAQHNYGYIFAGDRNDLESFLTGFGVQAGAGAGPGVNVSLSPTGQAALEAGVQLPNVTFLSLSLGFKVTDIADYFGNQLQQMQDGTLPVPFGA